MKYLAPNEFMPFAPTTIGKTISTYHCKRGKNNDRLYITRKDDATVVAFCHHCGKSGASKLNVPRNIYSYNQKNNVEQNAPLKLPIDSEIEFSKWPGFAQAWPLKYGITKDELRNNHISYSGKLGRVVLPVFDKEGELVRYQTRRVVPEGSPIARAQDSNPRKYDTRVRATSSQQSHVFIPRMGRHSLGSSTCVIVEDVLSAIKCARFVPSYAVMGSSLNDKDMLQIAQQHTNVFIFLDNDNHQVKKSMDKTKRKLELLIKGHVQIIRADKDPKEHSEKELEELLKWKNTLPEI